MASILIIDDALVMHDLFKRIFKKTEHKIVGLALNGKEGLKKYKELNPDIVILDIVMPELDGIKSIDLIQEYDPKSKIIVCSAYSTLKFVVEKVKSKQISCIEKPFDNEEIVDVVNRTLNGEKVELFE